MKLEIEIPDKYIGKNIRVFAGIEEVAHKLINEDNWQIKIQSCSRCGKCCGDCEFLVKDGGHQFRCDKGFKIPFECVSSDGFIPECTIIWRKD